MLLLRILVIFLGFGLATAGAQKADESQPYGRAAVTVVDGAGESRLSTASKPGEKRSLAVRLDANSPCEALVVALTRENGRLAFGWRPALVAMREWDERTVGAEGWAWTTAGPAFEVCVIFFAPGSPAVENMRRLVTAMQAPSLDPKVLNLQTNKLRELIGGTLALAVAGSSRLSAASPTEVAGVLRGDDFPWRDFAASANFTAEKPGVLVFDGPPAK